MADDFEQTKVHRLEDLLQAARKRETQSPYLIVLTGKSVGRMFRLREGDTLVGRGSECDLLLDDDGVSRSHARFIRRPDGEVAVLDLGSTNGTWVESTRVDYHLLSDGDRIQIGAATILKYGYQDAVEEQFVSQLYESATRDGLTGVYNKRFFLERLHEEFAWHVRHNEPLSLILIDIDHFKRVNDTWGHPAGDYVLREVARYCRKQVRSEDIFARYGGEEFVCILRQTDVPAAAVLADRLRRKVEDLKLRFGTGPSAVDIPVTVSVGVAQTTDAMESQDALVELADAYLYQAKQTGRNRVCFDGDSTFTGV